MVDDTTGVPITPPMQRVLDLLERSDEDLASELGVSAERLSAFRTQLRSLAFDTTKLISRFEGIRKSTVQQALDLTDPTAASTHLHPPQG